VPTYEYECDGCQRVCEVRQPISAPPLTTCEHCGGRLRRLLSPAPFILKGGGWYVTDYPSESRKKAMEAEKKSSDSTATAKAPDGGGSASTSSTSSTSTTSSTSESPTKS
jgi:putative FmdB family regulatory protein